VTQPDPDALVDVVVIAEAVATHPPGTPLDEHGNPIPVDIED
jgi:hypothetical protein